MKALMQNAPLLLSSIIDHAAKWHGEQEIVSLMGKGVLHRETYKEAQLRAKKLALALKRMGVKKGEVVATMAWNHYRHFESWYGVSGMGAVVHTLNPRLFPDQLIYIMNHAGAALLLLDVCFLPLIEKLAPHLPKIRGYVFFCGGDEMPEHGLQNASCYEELLEAESGDYEWEKLDENDACGICYTSGTTDEPKGVVYSHRSNVLHCLATLNNDVMGISACDVVMPVVPMFHA
ncbi:MAG: AMP-binding protein, partial [Parvibaculales bacterium]